MLGGGPIWEGRPGVFMRVRRVVSWIWRVIVYSLCVIVWVWVCVCLSVYVGVCMWVSVYVCVSLNVCELVYVC